MRVIRAKEIYYRYGKEEVLKGVSFEMQQGEILGILGDNGAGKSTLLSILATVQSPEKGQLSYFDRPKEAHSLQQLRKKIGYVPQEIALYTEESPYDNLKIFGRLHGLRGKVLRDKVEETLKVLSLEKDIHKPVSALSGGMKRRTNLGVALMHRPTLLILDEPAVGIDFISRKSILTALKKLAEQGLTIIYSTHALEEVQYICDRALVLEEGKIQQELPVGNRMKGMLMEQSLEEVLRSKGLTKEEEGL